MKLSRIGGASLPDVFVATRVDANPESARKLLVPRDAFAELSCRTPWFRCGVIPSVFGNAIAPIGYRSCRSEKESV